MVCSKSFQLLFARRVCSFFVVSLSFASRALVSLLSVFPLLFAGSYLQAQHPIPFALYELLLTHLALLLDLFA